MSAGKTSGELKACPHHPLCSGVCGVDHIAGRNPLLFNLEAFEQLRGQISMELDSPEEWRVTIATNHGQSFLYPSARSAEAAMNSAQITIDAFCWQDAEVVAVELEF